MSVLVEIQEHGPIREIRLARAPVNALNTDLCRALIGALNAAVAEGARGVVLSGGQKVFSAGLDVPHLMSHGEDREALQDSWNAFFGVTRTLAELRIPVVAALTGHSPAGGCVLALCCDYRIMARSPDPARPYAIGLNETQVGLVAPEGIQQLMRRVVGIYRAERLLVAGELVPADRALEIGLIDELVDAGRVVPRAVEWLQRLLELPQQPMLQTRAIARADLVAALHGDNMQLERFIEGWYAPDTQAALQSLVAKLGK
ncbi:MAG: enoyl-CoA hydratase/isomerase family protein [Lysobacteraceae bacterium]|nr:MAG: enoyl-CoA hydratase/isomerase family protein [Xanthomonadaceae bacterium]